MLDIALLRKDTAGIAARLKTRPYDLDVDQFNALESERKQVQTRTEELQARRNALSKQVGQLRRRVRTRARYWPKWRRFPSS